MTRPERYEFGGVALDVAERRLTCGTAHVHLSPKAFDVLTALARRAGQLVTKAELLAEVWPDAFVEEGILTVHIAALRKALVGADRGALCIETVPQSGYRLVIPSAYRARRSVGPARPGVLTRYRRGGAWRRAAARGL